MARPEEAGSPSQTVHHREETSLDLFIIRVRKYQLRIELLEQGHDRAGAEGGRGGGGIGGGVSLSVCLSLYLSIYLSLPLFVGSSHVPLAPLRLAEFAKQGALPVTPATKR